MPDPERLGELLGLIHILWKEDEDQRFNQLIYNLQREFSFLNNNLGKVVEKAGDGIESIGFDLFNVEDGLFIEFLKQKVAESNTYQGR
ncbi:hypothetical protein [Pseudoalteromonas luteoviolacea]|uniref:hypothetical protein n=1 Tax=Pseudoalteromonas luteoviolacea TaxID=43657 RepID=UPI0011505E26|nr:hypothetical protein [Pseudoalteromonas luteoviolacea]TQF70023.1 hypothetical protein FLM44_02715 [Pseudoalteromonas luteoviolacea]